MLILGIESSAVSAGCAAVKDGKLLSETYLNTGLTHSQTLLTLTQSCLSNAGLTLDEVDAFAVCRGPGSFTGIRIGVSLVKGLCFSQNKPVYGVSTLEALAWSAAIGGYLICPVMDARCMQVYSALFRKSEDGLERLEEDLPRKLDELAELLSHYDAPVLFVGDGAALASGYFEKSGGLRFEVFPEIFRFQHAAGVAFAAMMRYNKGDMGENAQDLQPSYLRLSQAERERNKGETK